MAMLFLTALLHAIVILGVSFNSGALGGSKAPQLDVLLVTNDVPEARNNPHPTYLAQRTQLGPGNTDAHVPPGSPASRGATVQAVAAPAGPTARDHSSETDGQEQVLTSSGASPDIRYFGEVIATAASAPAEPRGVLPGPPQS